MKTRIHIIIAETSDIIRNGLVHILHKFSNMDIDVAEIKDLSSIISQLKYNKPDILIIAPSNPALVSLPEFRNKINNPDLKIVALQNELTDKNILNNFDKTITVYDTEATIKNKLTQLINSNGKKDYDKNKELSDREKQIITCIAKGWSNKEIAEKLFLSVHTVMTHRRNIVNKLDIHSASGLTIYAIVNNLISVDEINI